MINICTIVVLPFHHITVGCMSKGHDGFGWQIHIQCNN